MKALFDADIIVFRAGFAAEKNQWFLSIGGEVPEVFAYKREAQARLDEVLPGKYSRVEGEDYQMWAERYLEPVENALHNARKMIDKALRACDCTEFDTIMYLSGLGHNFRHAVAKTRPYKGNRDKSHRPQHEEAVRKYIRSKWETVVTDGIEADDALGIAQSTTYGPSDSVIISLDKDLDMIPGLKYNFVNEVHYDVTPELAWKTFCLQLLTGDTVDNIPGLKGVGIGKATKMLDGLDQEDWLEECARQYASRSGREDWFTYFTEQATLLWIQQEPDQAPPIDPEWNDLGGDDSETIETDLFS